jgi:hypothetical protein
MLQMLLFILCYDAIQAQESLEFLSQKKSPAEIINALLSDEEVLWVGEVIVDYEERGELGGTPNYKKVLQKERVLHYHASNCGMVENADLRLIDGLFSIASMTAVYQTLQLTDKKEGVDLANSLLNIDTIVTFDAETFEEIIIEVKERYTLEEVPVLRIRQLIYFHKGEGAFYGIPLGVAPVEAKDKQANSLFWMPTTLVARLDFQRRTIPLAKRITTIIDLEKVNVLKSTVTQDSAFGLWYDKIVEDKKKKHLSRDILRDGFLPLSEQEKVMIGSRKDTLMKPDPSGFGEIWWVETYRYRGKGMKELQLIQDLAIDNSRNKFLVMPIGVGVIPEVPKKPNCYNKHTPDKLDFIHITSAFLLNKIKEQLQKE